MQGSSVWKAGMDFRGVGAPPTPYFLQKQKFNSLSSRPITGSFWAGLATFLVTCPVDRLN